MAARPGTRTPGLAQPTFEMSRTPRQNPKDYLLAEPVECICPSGLRVKLQPPGPDAVLKIGRFAAGMLERKSINEIPPEKMTEWLGMVVSAVCVEPRFSLHPGPGEYRPSQLQPEDAFFIHQWAVARFPKSMQPAELSGLKM